MVFTINVGFKLCCLVSDFFFFHNQNVISNRLYNIQDLWFLKIDAMSRMCNNYMYFVHYEFYIFKLKCLSPYDSIAHWRPLSK